MINRAGLLTRAECIAKQKADRMYSDKNSSEYKEAYQKIMHKLYMEMIRASNICKYCGK